jgi:transposase
MKKEQGVTANTWKAQDLVGLGQALKAASDARLYQRLLALRMVARGWPIPAVSRLLQCSRQSIYNWLKRFGRRHRATDLQEASRCGRPQSAAVLTAARILRELHRCPLHLGYAATTWTVALLAGHLRRRYGCPITERTLRRRMKQMGLEWKRPRYVYAEKDPQQAQKRGPSFAAYAACLRGQSCWSRTKP